MSNGDETIEVQGTRVPVLGFGTWLVDRADAADAVRDALEIGYRQIDTARAYENEREVGRGIADSGVPRDEIFLTTKVPHTDAAPDLVERDAEESLERLGVDYVDLLLLHWPNPDVPLEQTLGALDRLRDDGRVRQIGVSNFPAGLLRQALEMAPAVRQPGRVPPVPRPGAGAGRRARPRRDGHRLLPARSRAGAE